MKKQALHWQFYEQHRRTGPTRRETAHWTRLRPSQGKKQGFADMKKPPNLRRFGGFVVEHIGFEPMTSTLPVWHSSQLS